MRPRPPDGAAVVERRREQQRAKADADAGQRGDARGRVEPAAQQERQHHGDRDREQERRRLQEREARAFVVDAEVGGREAAGDERRQERPQPGRRAQADALEDVEQELHGGRYRAAGMTVEDGPGPPDAPGAGDRAGPPAIWSATRRSSPRAPRS